MAENYGHVIFEAMAGGCVPIISDKTPWTEEKAGNCGEVVELERENAVEDFAEAVEKYAGMTQLEKRRAADKCIAFAMNYHAEKAEEQYRKIFGRG